MPSRRADALPPLPAAARTALDPAAQEAFGKLVALRLAALRGARVAEHGEIYSQARVARVLGRSQTWLSNLELGHRRVDTAALLVLAAFYGVSAESLVRPPATAEERARVARWEREVRQLRGEATREAPARPRRQR